MNNRQRAQGILRRSVKNPDVSIFMLVEALEKQEFLGFGKMGTEKYEDLLERVAANYRKGPQLRTWLTFPEYIIVIAYQMGHITTREDFSESRLIILDMLGTVGGVSRFAHGLKEHFNWTGWALAA